MSLYPARFTMLSADDLKLQNLCDQIEGMTKLSSIDNKHVYCKYLAVGVADLMGFYVIEVYNVQKWDEATIIAIKRICCSDHTEVESDISNKNLVRVLVPKYRAATPEARVYRWHARVLYHTFTQPSLHKLLYSFLSWTVGACALLCFNAWSTAFCTVYGDVLIASWLHNAEGDKYGTEWLRGLMQHVLMLPALGIGRLAC